MFLKSSQEVPSKGVMSKASPEECQEVFPDDVVAPGLYPEVTLK